MGARTGVVDAWAWTGRNTRYPPRDLPAVGRRLVIRLLPITIDEK